MTIQIIVFLFGSTANVADYVSNVLLVFLKSHLRFNFIFTMFSVLIVWILSLWRIHILCLLVNLLRLLNVQIRCADLMVIIFGIHLIIIFVLILSEFRGEQFLLTWLDQFLQLILFKLELLIYTAFLDWLLKWTASRLLVFI